MPYKYQLREVFLPGGFPKLTYVARKTLHLEENILVVLHNLCKIMVVTGATKSGKTVVVKQSLGSANPIWLDGGLLHTLDEFWQYLGAELKAEFVDREVVLKENTYGVVGQIKGAISALFTKGEASISPSVSSKLSRSQSSGAVSFLPAQLLSALRESCRPLIVDDFHFIAKDLQAEITRALKPAIFNGTPVIYLAIPHHRFDAVKVEREMNGRIEHVRVPSWDAFELRQISTIGFPLLGLNIHDQLIDSFINESQGSPHLMQEFCRSFALRCGVTETVSPAVTASPKFDLRDLFAGIADGLSKHIFDKLASGPRKGAPRKQRQLLSGNVSDIYTLVLLALAEITSDVSTVRYDTLRLHVRRLLNGDPPEARDVYRALDQMSTISISESASSPVLYFDKEERVIHLTDPFFLFFLRWSLNSQGNLATKSMQGRAATGKIQEAFRDALDAASAENLHEYFVLQEQGLQALTSCSQIIYGFKGSGKTALRRYLAEFNRHRFFAAGTLELNNFGFRQLYQALLNLSVSVKREASTLGREAWMHLLVAASIDLVGRELPEDSQLVRDIGEIFPNAPSALELAHQRFLWYIEHIFSEAGDSASSISSRLNELLARCATSVRQAGRRVVLCLDGFDSVVDHEPESRRLLLSVLIDAVFRLSRNEVFGSAFCVKAFLSRELTYDAEMSLWDSDKYLSSTTLLLWTEDGLKEMIARRLATAFSVPGKKERSFDSLWSVRMPERVHNRALNVEESTFSFILRHTQHRPRQLLTQIMTIFNEWEQHSGSLRIDPHFVYSTVLKTTRDLAHVAVNQLELAIPGVSTFLGAWRVGSSTISFAECLSKARRTLGLDNVIKTRHFLDGLFSLGVLGIINKENIRPGGKIVNARFSYYGIRIRPADDDIIAMCPMFAEYCGCSPSEYGLVQPAPG